MRARLMLSLAASLLAAIAPATQAAPDGWPQRPVTLVISDPPGGGQDTIARLVAEGVGKRLGQPVIVENKPGASGMIGAQQVARAAPDGYTALFSVTGLIMNPLLFPTQAKYDPFKDFAPVANTVQAPLLFVVGGHVPARTLAEFFALAQAKPGVHTYGSIGEGSVTHVYSELLAGAGGVKLMHIPYQGGGPVLQAMLGGQIDAGFLTYGSVRAHLASGKLRALAVTGEARLPTDPGIPTFIESGYPDFRYSGWMGIFMPAGTPRERVQAFADAVRETVLEPATSERLLAMGVTPDGSGPAELGAALARDDKRWRDWIPRFGIKPQ